MRGSDVFLSTFSQVLSGVCLSGSGGGMRPLLFSARGLIYPRPWCLECDFMLCSDAVFSPFYLISGSESGGAMVAAVDSFQFVRKW